MYILKFISNRYQFTPGIPSTLVTLLFFLLFVYLGNWQWQRMTLKKSIETMLAQPITHEIDLDLLDLALISSHFSTFQYQAVSLTGRFMVDKLILLDNQILDRQLGYRVLTPFLTQNPPRLILVDRGWVPYTGHRATLPILSTHAQTMTLKGRLIQIRSGLILQKDTLTSSTPWPIRVQSIDYSALSPQLPYPLLPFILQLSAGHANSFIPFPIQIGVSSKRHLGYALQWFTMALSVLIYYSVINLKRVL